MRSAFNDGWEFTETFSEKLFDPGFKEGLKNVRLPHTVKETSFNYFPEETYQMICGYRRSFFVPEEWKDKRVFVRFGAAAHGAEVFCNGKKVGEHFCGYTAFKAELTETLEAGKDNLIVVRLNTREDQNVPPFGFVIDYMTYGGLYREAELEIKEKSFIDDVFVKASVPDGVRIPERVDEAEKLAFEGVLQPEVTVCGDKTGLSLRFAATERETGKTAPLGTFPIYGDVLLKLPDARLWDTERPWLYTLKTELIKDGRVIDTEEKTFGFRKSVFRADGYYINDRRVFLRGLDRHQSWPYVGYAMPASQQRFDADILRHELGLDIVRTSHYPQSPHFIDRCDEIGLLVFTEIPGWQHIGDEEWKAQAVKNTEEMVIQYRDHPSVILWGVRINESADDDEFYKRTNAAAHRLDPTRQTSGVRCFRKSSLIEDVYAFNDFIHNGKTPGCRKKSAVTPDMSKGYIITEHNGHMFPTKSFDDEEQRQEHALRHARVQNAAAGEPGIAGCLGWCMSDYNTHREFGSGDRICYHGVLDMFRNPKTAAALYASQQEERDVLEIGSHMDVGEHPEGHKGNVWIFTNADSVRMYKKDGLIKEYFAKDSPFRSLKHGPILIDDYIGDRLAPEGFSKKKEKAVKDILNHIARFGDKEMPLGIKLKALRIMCFYGMKYKDAYRLYGKYQGDWGTRMSGFRFEAIKDGKVVSERVCASVNAPVIKAEASHTLLYEGDTYDVAAVRISVCGENGEILRCWNTPVKLELYGDAEIIGPDRAFIAGGTGGTYIRTVGKAGEVKLKLSLPEEYGAPAAVIDFTVEKR